MKLKEYLAPIYKHNYISIEADQECLIVGQRVKAEEFLTENDPQVLNSEVLEVYAETYYKGLGASERQGITIVVKLPEIGKEEPLSVEETVIVVEGKYAGFSGTVVKRWLDPQILDFRYEVEFDEEENVDHNEIFRREELE